MPQSPMKIRHVNPRDAEAWLHLRDQLWPGEGHVEDIARFFAGASEEPSVVFVAEDGVENGHLAGFAEISVRRDYVEGAHSTPVAYLEGWFVEPALRRRGIGRQLLAAAEKWAANQGYREFGSDVEADNFTSLAAHRAAGFQECQTLVHLIKSIEPVAAE
jgi:aminoglycoside 6'-N-acetyltransferase I